MNLDNHIILLVGASGSGKTSITRKLYEMYGHKSIESYTTRPKRHENETGHTFVTLEEFDALRPDMCAIAEFDGNWYGATNKQVDEANIYVIDPVGVEMFRKEYIGKKTPIVVYLSTDPKVCYKRMRRRGDSFFKARKRVKHDKKHFEACKYDILVPANGSLKEVVNRVITSVNYYIAIHNVHEENNDGN